MEKELKAEEETGFSRWRWFGLIERLCDGDITKWEEVLDMNFLFSLDIISYWDERDEYKRKATE